jgi:hypothetical protein
MRAREELTARLTSALSELAAERTPEVVAEAEAEARQAVKEILREELTRAMLAASEQLLAAAPEPKQRPEPKPKLEADEPTPEQGEGLWLYCVVGQAHPGLPAHLEGVSPGRPPRLLRLDGLAAVVSAVPLSEFGEEGLRRNLNDLEWLESMARAHEAVLDVALAHETVVPMRVCTIYRGEEHMRTALAERREILEDALVRLADRSEWGVKMLADRERVEQLARDRAGATDPAGAGEGVAYLARKQLDRAVREQSERIVDEAVRECHARLEEWAAASQVLPPQNKELSGHEGDMVFNGAYLVDDERIQSFEGVTGELERSYAELGMKLELTGPWPAYHFVEIGP